MPGLRELARHLAAPDSDGRVPARLQDPYPYLWSPGHPRYAEARRRVSDDLVFRLWSRSRVVYAPDPDMLAALTESAQSPIPSQVLHAIPHPDPYILLPPAAPGAREASGWEAIGTPLGAFTFGRRDRGLTCSTTDERREALGLMFTNVISAPGGRVILSTLRVTLRHYGQPLTVDQMVQEAVGRFRFNDSLPASERAHLEAWLRRHVGQVACTLLYCCTADPDMTTAYQRETTGKRGSRRLRPGEVTDLQGIGYRLGPALFQARRQAGERAAAGTGDGGHRVPHWRRGHPHVYWTGRGRTVPKLNWVFPVLVNKDLLGDAEGPPAVVRPLRQRRAPGAEPAGLPLRHHPHGRLHSPFEAPRPVLHRSRAGSLRPVLVPGHEGIRRTEPPPGICRCQAAHARNPP